MRGRSLRTRISVGIAAPAIGILVLSCVTIYSWVSAREMGHLDRSLEMRAAAMASLVDLDGGIWDVEFDRADVPVVELFGALSAYEVRVAANGGLIAQRRLDEPGLFDDLPPDPLAALSPERLAALPSDRPLELSGSVQTVELESGRSFRTWTGVYLVRAHEGDPGEGARMPVGAPSGPAAPVVRIAVAQDLAPIRGELAALLGTELATGVALSVLALLAGGVLSRRIVAPIEHIARRAAEVRAPSAVPPLTLAGTGDEIDQLAEALNQSYLRLHAAYALQGRFTADASHELRTPLAVIRSNAELALRQPRPTYEYEAVLAAVVSGAVRIEGVIEGLLLLARADAGGQEGARERIDLPALAAEVLDDLQPVGLGPSLRVEGEEDAAVFGDAVQLDVLLRNLLTNAIRHTPASGEVVVHVDTTDTSVILEVRDTGEGIPPDALPHVFDRFFRADEARSRDAGGAGLGLSIVQAVVLQHGGTIDIESAHDRGTVVRVRFPRAAAPMTRKEVG
ncbi:MAG: HAMP domain-containing sensor histidine kinase [Myxococcota bacterium]